MKPVCDHPPQSHDQHVPLLTDNAFVHIQSFEGPVCARDSRWQEKNHMMPIRCLLRAQSHTTHFLTCFPGRFGVPAAMRYDGTQAVMVPFGTLMYQVVTDARIDHSPHAHALEKHLLWHENALH